MGKFFGRHRAAPGPPHASRIERTGGRLEMKRVTVLALGAVAMVACGGGTTTTTTSGPFKAAWVYVGPINDGGWTQAHNDGRLYVQQQLGSQLVTTYKE